VETSERLGPTVWHGVIGSTKGVGTGRWGGEKNLGDPISPAASECNACKFNDVAREPKSGELQRIADYGFTLGAIRESAGQQLRNQMGDFSGRPGKRCCFSPDRQERNTLGEEFWLR
jgi:hypothetical protein